MVHDNYMIWYASFAVFYVRPAVFLYKFITVQLRKNIELMYKLFSDK